MTLDQICDIGKALLADYQPALKSGAIVQVEPPIEIGIFDSDQDLTEIKVRQMIVKVLNDLSSLPEGQYMARPLSTNIGGVEQRVIRHGNVALGVRLEFDGSIMKTKLLIGGYILRGEMAAG